jgi:hypothetical protein
MCAALLGGSAAAADEWRLGLADTEAGIRVYLRTRADGYREFRGVTRVKSRLSACVALLRDVERMPQWVYRNRKAQVLQRVSETQAYAYTVSAMDWPLRDRDAIVLSTLAQDLATLAVTIRGSARPDFRPRDERYVRMPVVESFWRFTPLGAGLVEVEFQGYGDPGGNLSAGLLKWIAQNAIWEAPYRTLLGLRDAIGEARYQSASFRHVVEPAP